MRILFCNYEYPPLGGGGGVVNAALAQELAQRHDVTVLTSRALSLPASETVAGVRVLRVPVYFRRQRAAASMLSLLAYLPSGIIGGRRLFGSESFDIVNAHFVLPSGPVGRNLSRFLDVPHVISVHGGDLYDPSKWTSPHRHLLLRKWIGHLLRTAEQVIGQSRNTLKNMREFYAPEIEGIRIPLGITRPKVPESDRSEFGFTPENRLLVTIGRLVARKAVDQLILSIVRLGDENARLIIIGTGPFEEDLRQQAATAGIADQVVFMGNVDEGEKYKLLSIADAFVSTSQHEGFGLVFIEAMAVGLPVVCYDFGGQTDFLEDGRTGGLVPLNDLDAFVESVRHTIGDSDFSDRVRRENLERVEEFFIDSCAIRYETVFEDILRRRSEK